MDDGSQDLVRIDASGMVHPLGRTASQRLRARKGTFRLLPAPSHLLVMRLVGEDGRRDAEDGPVFRLAGEVTAPGALCDVVALVGQAGWRGELVVFDGGHSRSIFFEAGHVVGAQSSAEGERLGEVLYRYGALTEEQVERVMAAVGPRLRFGEAAVELGFLTREKLFHLMAKQTEEIVYATLLVGDGTFYFLEAYDEARLMARQNIAVGALLMEGVRRMDETKYFRERIPSDEHIPVRVNKSPPAEDELRSVWEAIDGTRSVAEICRTAGMGEFEVTQALFQLVQKGSVSVHAPRPTSPLAIVELFNHAVATVLREADRMNQGAKVREELSEFATGAGVYDALFRRAGPAADGTFAAPQVIENVAVLVGPEEGLSMLKQWLYEYASFAAFVGERHVRREGDRPALARSVAELLAPIAPE